MLLQNEPIAAMVAGCCSPLQYLEGAAYIAIVLAVLGVPQLLTYYLTRGTAATSGGKTLRKRNASVGKNAPMRNGGTRKRWRR